MFFIAFRYLFSKKYQFLPSFSVFVAFFGVFLSVAVLILVSSVIGGFKQDFERLVIGTRPHISLYPKNGEFQSMNFNIKLNEKIKSVSPVVSGEGIVSFNKKNNGVLIKGVEDDYFLQRKMLKKSIIEGEFKENFAVVGIELAKKMGIQIGDKISIFSSKTRQTIFGAVPVHKEFVVSGFFGVNMYFYDSSSVYLHIHNARGLFLENGVANVVEIELENPQMVDNFNFQILEKVGGYFSTWKSENGSFIEAIATQEAVMFLILSLFLLIASFIIFSTISSVVNEKERQMAVLQSFGLRKEKVLGIFLIFGSMIVLPAIALGSTLGILLAINLEAIKNWLEEITNLVIFDSAHYFLAYIPSVVEWWKVGKIILFAIGLCGFCIIIPGLRSTKIMPSRSLRFE